MDWFAPVDIYCERVDAAFWSEPLNALSNIAFILAALWGAFEARRRGVKRLSIWLLVSLALCIGVGSFLFHTFATAWAGVADSVPIWTFVAAYTLITLVLVGEMSLRGILLFLAAAGIMIAVSMQLVAQPDPADHYGLQPRSRFNGSEQYLPAVILMLIITAATQVRGHPIRWWFTAATLTFVFSLTLRTLDLALCDVWPYGTHMFWHLLNGTMIALLLQAVIRHITRTQYP